MAEGPEELGVLVKVQFEHHALVHHLKGDVVEDVVSWEVEKWGNSKREREQWHARLEGKKKRAHKKA